MDEIRTELAWLAQLASQSHPREFLDSLPHRLESVVEQPGPRPPWSPLDVRSAYVSAVVVDLDLFRRRDADDRPPVGPILTFVCLSGSGAG